jgi:molecular chaperone HtpG
VDRIEGAPVAEAFQVDLRGVVDLLSHHLYSGPRVYVRELLQNGVDAVTARLGEDPDAPQQVTFVPADVAEDGRLHVIDTGTGLTPEQVQQFLATIGRSSKRDELGFARGEFLGQFGIGLLSCFLVTDEIELVTQAVSGGPVVRWRGRADGAYDTEILETAPPGLEVPPGGGTHVALDARPGSREMLELAVVERLARHYGSLLPYDIVVRSGDGDRIVARTTLPWAVEGSPSSRRRALVDYAEQTFGISAFEVLPIAVPEAGLTGVAVILGASTAPGSTQRHRVHLKRMLLGDAVEDLLPEWAFFVRCIVNADNLRPTASREALYDDDLLEHTREQLGDQIRRWLSRLAATDPERMGAFLDLHSLGVKSLALHDDDMFDLLLPLLRFQTTLGPVPLEEFRRTHDVVRYTRTVDEFRQVSAVAAAQGVGVVNGGYVYDTELLERLGQRDATARVEAITPADLDAHVQSLPAEEELALRGFLAAARAVLDRLGCDVELRVFSPMSLPVLYLDDRDSRQRRDLRQAQSGLDPLWADVLGAFDDGGRDRPRLLLNARNPTVRRVFDIDDEALRAVAVESLYCQALLLGHHPLRAADSAVLNRAFLGLLDWAVPEGGAETERSA